MSSGVLATPALAQETAAPRRSASIWRRFLQNRRLCFGLLIVGLIGTLSLAAPVVTSHNPVIGNFATTLAPPSRDNLMGTDYLGRDIFTRVLHGYRVSLLVALVSVLIAVLAGTPIGLLAGYASSRVDNLLMRPLDLLMAFPALLLAVTLVAVFGTKTAVTMAALAIIYLPIMARVLRGAVLSVRNEEYVEAARAIGAASPRVLLRHILPNSIGPLVVQASISMGIAILIEAALSFIGLGTQPPKPSLGAMLAENKDFMTTAWWTVTFPGLAIMSLVLGFNLLGDGFRDFLTARRR